MSLLLDALKKANGETPSTDDEIESVKQILENGQSPEDDEDGYIEEQDDTLLILSSPEEDQLDLDSDEPQDLHLEIDIIDDHLLDEHLNSEASSTHQLPPLLNMEEDEPATDEITDKEAEPEVEVETETDIELQTESPINTEQQSLTDKPTQELELAGHSNADDNNAKHSTSLQIEAIEQPSPSHASEENDNNTDQNSNNNSYYSDQLKSSIKRAHHQSNRRIIVLVATGVLATVAVAIALTYYYYSFSQQSTLLTDTTLSPPLETADNLGPIDGTEPLLDEPPIESDEEFDNDYIDSDTMYTENSIKDRVESEVSEGSSETKTAAANNNIEKFEQPNGSEKRISNASAKEASKPVNPSKPDKATNTTTATKKAKNPLIARNPKPTLQSSLDLGYKALNEARLEEAYKHYKQAFSFDTTHRDVLLGLAAIEIEQGNWPQALERYQTLLDINPRDELANTGILRLTQSTNPRQLETRLKIIISESPQPSALLLSTLGSLYIQLQEWSKAQEIYFKAWTQAPQDPNIAYNMAISLEHLGKYREALRFYRTAVDNSLYHRPLFDTQTLSLRIYELEDYLNTQTQ